MRALKSLNMEDMVNKNICRPPHDHEDYPRWTLYSRDFMN